MLHDLIYALGGHPGNIFKEMSVGKIEIVPGLPYISPSEEAELNHLLQLATKYIYFQKFINSHTLTLYVTAAKDISLVEGLRHGCYLKAFCLGLENVLTEYRNCLLKIEKEILADAHLSLLYIQQATEKYHVLFNAMHDVIATIKSRKAHGCQILDVLYRSARSGNAFVKQSIIKIMNHCHVVMYKQLSSWLLHGLLIDRHHEFFIIAKQPENSSLNESSDEALEKTLKDQQEDFDVRLTYLPSYIPARIAHVICFIGSSLHLFESDEYEVNAAGSSLLMKFGEVDIKDTQFKLEGILQDKELKFLEELRLLQQADEFNIENFEMCIDKIRCSVARELWELCVERAQLVSHLNMLKDFFLLGRGELFLVFIDEASQLLKNPPSRVTEHDVQQTFLRSAAKIQIEDEIPFQLFQLTIKQNVDPKKFSPFPNIYTVDNGWARLGMTFKVTWPLHTIFKPLILEKYNQLFKFLLRVRRTQAALQNIWCMQMRKRQEDDAIYEDGLVEKPDSNFSITAAERLQWQCRNQMQFFVDNLQYYLQADVLESHFTHLINKIRTTDEALRDFESITLAHDNFLNALMSQCFVMSNTVCTSLIEILDLCQQFCDVVVTSSLLISKEDIHERVQKMWELFSKKTFVFFQVLSGVCSNQCNPHISQLTLRLDYNRFYSVMITKSKETAKGVF